MKGKNDDMTKKLLKNGKKNKKIFFQEIKLSFSKNPISFV
jgi:hypothetical protein